MSIINIITIASAILFWAGAGFTIYTFLAMSKKADEMAHWAHEEDDS